MYLYVCVEIDVFLCVCGGRLKCLYVFLGIDVFVFVSGEIDVFVCVSVWRLKFLYVCVCVGGGVDVFLRVFGD